MVWRHWGSGPAVVLLHGGSGSWTHWLKNIDALARDHTLWIPDLPGCGDSALPPGAYDADSVFEHVAAGIAQVAQGQAVDLVGFSFGALVCGFIAAHHPELVRRLVLVAPPALGLKHPPVRLQSLGRQMSPEQHESAIRHNLAATPKKGAKLIERHAIDVLQHHDEFAFVLKKIEERDDRWVRQPRVS